MTYPRMSTAWLAGTFARWFTYLNPDRGLVPEQGWEVRARTGELVLTLTMANDPTYPQGPRRFEVRIAEVPPLEPTTPGSPWTPP